ncbi:hypothetical protein UY3_04990 [Chelonia mydas]|uniref:Uncharacterized protein n=1 Tax=Chelonia mydas TaxID=8469 RepID=M7BKH8_CHEMY|nr:hypothetical protein UY3_04990 [Chelonia mydas]
MQSHSSMVLLVGTMHGNGDAQQEPADPEEDLSEQLCSFQRQPLYTYGMSTSFMALGHPVAYVHMGQKQGADTDLSALKLFHRMPLSLKFK